MIRPIVIIGFDEDTKKMTVQGPDAQNREAVIISYLCEAIKIVSAPKSPILVPERN
jgi:hypothetical protein